MTGHDDSYPTRTKDDWWVAEPASNPIREKSFEFALMIVDLCRHLQSNGEYVLSKQLIRSGTSIGANVEESVSAESRKDFSHKLNVALKEAREAHYWLRLLDASPSVPPFDLTDHLAAAEEIVRLLAAITKRLKDT